MQSKAKTVDAYMNEVSEDRLDAIKQLRNLCLEILDGYEESMNYGMPGYNRPGEEIEVAFASQKNYISFYILKQEVLDKYREKLSGINLGKGCIRYSSPRKIDFQIVRDLLTDSFHSDAEIC